MRVDDLPVLTRRRLLALLGVGGAAAAVPWRWSTATDRAPGPPGDGGPEVPVPTTEPALLQPAPAPTVADLAASLGWDVEAMFRFVADDIDYEPYNGSLRGATGALWGGAANSVDKALLLGALLNEAGVPWRFAVGELDAAARERVATNPARPVPELRRRQAERVLPSDVAAEWSGDGPWRRAPEVDDLLRVAAERTEATYALLVDALSAAGIAPPEPRPPVPVEEVERHVWVQIADGPAWIDLDATLPGGHVGETLAPASETLVELPGDRFHTVTFRLVAEVVTAGTPTMTEVVSYTIRSADAGGVPIYVVHAPATWLDVGGAIAGQQRYRPAILAGSEIVMASTFVALDKGEGALDALGETGDAEGQTLAEWLEVDVTVPGAGVRTERRLVFDRIPAERRESRDLGLDDLPPIEFVHVDDEIGDVFVPCASPYLISIVSQPVLWSSLGLDGSSSPTADDLVARSTLALPYVHGVVALHLVDQLAGVVRLDEPLVTALRVDPNAAAGGTALTVDRLHVSLDLHVFEDRADAGWGGVLAGAAGHVAERSLVAAVASVLGGDRSVAETSVGRLFELAVDAGTELRVLTTLEPGATDGMTAATGALVRSTLEAGRYVVIPAAPVEVDGVARLGWWEYDSADGRIVDRMDDGGHATAAEWAALVKGILIGVFCGYPAVGMAVAAAGSMGAANTAGRDFIVAAVAITTGSAAAACAGVIAFPL
jgi:hypothetical protein